MQVNQLFVDFFICSGILADNILTHEFVVDDISFVKKLVVSFKFNQRDDINNLEFRRYVEFFSNFLELKVI